MKVLTAAPMFLLQDVNIHKLSVTVGCLYRSPRKCCIRTSHYHMLDYKHYSELGHQHFLLRFLRLGTTQTCPGLQIWKILKKQMAPTTDPPEAIQFQTKQAAWRPEDLQEVWREDLKARTGSQTLEAFYFFVSSVAWADKISWNMSCGWRSKYIMIYIIHMGDVLFVAVCVRVPALFFVSAIAQKCKIRIGRHEKTQRSFAIQESKRNGIGITHW